MSPSLEHDYIGLSEVPSTESSEKASSSACTTTEEDEKKLLLKYEETELRLGLPGSDSLETEAEKIRSNKRVFSDAIDVSGKWGFEGEVSKGSALFSPKGKLLNGLENPAVKEVGSFPKPHAQENKSQISSATHHGAAPAAKAQVVGWPPIRSFRRNTRAQVVGWPPIRSFRKNTMTMNPTKNNDDAEGKTGHDCLYIKVSMDGAPYLRKVDLKTYGNYMELSSALEKMFSCLTIGQCGSHGIPCKDGLSERRLMDLLHGSEYVLTYEDKDGDWMLVGDVPWEMFINSCKRLRIMKSSEAIGLAPRAMEKCKNRY